MACDLQTNKSFPNIFYQLQLFNLLPCLAKIALESPVLAQITVEPSKRTVTKVEPLHKILIYWAFNDSMLCKLS